MKTKFFALLAMACFAVGLTGCVATVDGHTKAAMPFRKDKITSRYEFSVPKVFAAVRQTLKEQGVIEAENTINNSYVAKINECSVWVIVEEINPNLTQVTVQVRTRGGFPNLDIAAEVDKVIALNLR